MNVKNCLNAMVVVTMLALMPLTAWGKGNDRGDRPQGPPPEAIEACDGKSAGDSVTFTGRQGESLSATCEEIDGQLAAVPEGMKGGNRPQ